MTDLDHLESYPGRLRRALSLSSREVTLVELAVAASPGVLGAGLLPDRVRAARAAGISEPDVAEACRLGSLVAFHSVTWGLKVAADELGRLGVRPPEPDGSLAEVKEAYLAHPARQWSEPLAFGEATAPHVIGLMAEYVPDAVEGHGVTDRERELICLAIDMNCNHMYEDGLRNHVRAGLRAGITAAEMTEVAMLLTWLQQASVRALLDVDAGPEGARPSRP